MFDHSCSLSWLAACSPLHNGTNEWDCRTLCQPTKSKHTAPLNKEQAMANETKKVQPQVHVPLIIHEPGAICSHVSKQTKETKNNDVQIYVCVCICTQTQRTIKKDTIFIFHTPFVPHVAFRALPHTTG
jgi:hypothetical protein